LRIRLLKKNKQDNINNYQKDKITNKIIEKVINLGKTKSTILPFKILIRRVCSKNYQSQKYK